MAPIFCIDFDDTIVEQDIASQLLERFADPSWTELRDRRRRGELTLEEYSAAAIDLVQAPEQDLVAHAMEVAKPRAGFMELLDWAQWNDWQSAVVSNGWDIYIDPILKELGADRIARHCGRARFGYRWRVRYYSPRGVELVDAFKTSYVASYRDQGDFVAFIGDGPSDVEPANAAHVVFARDTLWEELKDHHERVFPYETFHDIIEIMERNGDAWLSSFSSTTAAEA